MYVSLTFVHSILRWLVLLSLVYAIIIACRGYFSKAVFSKAADRVRHWTATIAHIQLMAGMILYMKSPLVKYFWPHFREAKANFNPLFFGLIHILLMLIAIVLVTIGSSLAKRKAADADKFKTMMIWFSIALLIIFIAIPWPFSPLASRPYFR